VNQKIGLAQNADRLSRFVDHRAGIDSALRQSGDGLGDRGRIAQRNQVPPHQVGGGIGLQGRTRGGSRWSTHGLLLLAVMARGKIRAAVSTPEHPRA
jgi:hypothetical protein